MENHSRSLYLWLQKNILLLLICKRWLYLYYFIVSLIFVNQARGKQHLCGHYSQNIFHNKSMAETHPAVILMSRRSSPLRPLPPTTTLCVLALEHAPPKPLFATIENLSAPLTQTKWRKCRRSTPRRSFFSSPISPRCRGRILFAFEGVSLRRRSLQFRTNNRGALIWLGVCLSVLLCSSLTRLTHLDVVFFLFSIYIILSVYWLSSNN
jgi:hypothetical protein